MTDNSLLVVILVLTGASLIRCVLGFGEALIAVPLLALFIPVEQAAPLAVLVSTTIAAMVLLRDWRRVQFRSAVSLLVPTLFGIPLGILLLRFVADPIVKGVLAVAILGFSGYSLLYRQRGVLKDDRSAWIFGFHAGILGGAYGMNGPPLAVYGSLRGWDPGQFRATLQAYFLPASLVGMCGYWLAGIWTQRVNTLYLAALPGVILATLAGQRISRTITPGRFRTLVYCGLLAIGCLLLYQSVAA